MDEKQDAARHGHKQDEPRSRGSDHFHGAGRLAEQIEEREIRNDQEEEERDPAHAGPHGIGPALNGIERARFERVTFDIKCNAQREITNEDAGTGKEIDDSVPPTGSANTSLSK